MRKSAVVKVPVGAVIFGVGKLPENLLLLLEGRVRNQQSLQPERAKVADLYAARSATITPLPWSTFAPPLPLTQISDKVRTMADFRLSLAVLLNASPLRARDRVEDFHGEMEALISA